MQSAISGALAVLQKANGAEKNLLLKNYVQDIKYSKEKIEMAFYYQPSKKSPNNKGFEASSQSTTAISKKSKSRSKGGGIRKPANREPASDGLLRPTPAAAVRNLNLCGERGIRTPGRLPYTRFPSEHFRPLRHLSNFLESCLRFSGCVSIGRKAHISPIFWRAV